MAGRGRDLIAADVHKLITQLSGFSETEDPENFELCEKFAFSNLLHHRFLSVDSHAVRRSVLGMVTKFMIHGHIEASRRLDSLLKKYLKLNIFKDKEVQWGILSLLVKLADNPTSHIDDDKFSSSKEENEEDTSKPFNWTTYSHFCDYLREGNENFDTNFNASSDSEWEDMASDPEKPREQPIIHEVVETSLVAEADFDSHPVEHIETVQTQLVEHHRKCAGAEEWLSDNVQDPWWTSTQLAERVNSIMPSANFSKLWDTYCESTTSTVSEYKVLREILWMLQAPTTTALFQELDGQFVVQPNMSIPSLTMSTTLGYLNTLCEYFTMIHHLQKFQKEIYPMDANFSAEMNVKQAPHTFEAYTVSVVDFLRTIQGLACEIEKKIKKQDDIYTLYSLNLELGPKMSQLRAIFNAHVNATKGWRESENWLSSARLLSVLYEEALSCMECDSPCVLLKMFLKSFRPYVDLIDLWLTEGRLEDYRNEFIITKKTDSVENEEWGSDFSMRPFIDNLKSSCITPLPLLQVIAEKVLHAGRNMQLLQRLDRLGDMRSQNSNCGRMYGEFLVALEKEVAFSMKDKEKMDVSLPVVEPSSTSDGDKTCSDRFITNVTTQLEELKDSFLMHAFRDYIPFKSVTHKKEPEMLNTIEEVFRRLALYSTCGLIPLKPVMERILSQLIDAKHSTACLLVKSIFLQEFNLSTHIGLIRAIYLMEAGDIMHRFCYFIFKEAEHGLLWANSYTLTAKLEECINLRYPEHSSKFSISVNDNAKLNGTVSVMDEINIEYHVDWPLTVILSAKNMEYYNSVFQFLLKVKWALWTLEGLRFSDLENATQGLDPDLKIRARCLHLLRFWLLHSVGSVHTYLMGQVLHSLGLQLEQDLNNSMDLDSLVRSHNNYVNLVHNHCLQPRSSDVIKAAILQMVQLSLELHEIWSQGVGFVQESKLLNMTDLYIKCHCFLGSVLQTAVELGHASHLSAPVPFSSSSALNKCSVFADHMQYSLAFLSWQQDPPLGISTPLPTYLLKYLEIDAWNDKRTDTLLNTQKLETFLDNYFVYLSGMKKICNSRLCINSIGGSCHTIQRSSRSMSNAFAQYSTNPLGLYMDSLVSTLRSETCVPRYPPIIARPLRNQDIRDRSETECSYTPLPQTPDSENEAEMLVDNDTTKDDSLDSQKIDDIDEEDQDFELPKETENEDIVNQTATINLELHKHDTNSKLHLADVPEEVSSHIELTASDSREQEDFLVLNMQVSETRAVSPAWTDSSIVKNPSFPSVLHIEENFIGVEKKSAMMEVSDGVTTEISTSLISCSFPLKKVSPIQNSFVPVARSINQMSTLQVPERQCPCDGCESPPTHSETSENEEDSSASTVTSVKGTHHHHHEKSLLLNQRTLKNIRQKCVKPNIKHASKSGRRFYDCGSNILPKSNMMLKGKKRILSSIPPLGAEFSVHSKQRSSESSTESLNFDDVSNLPPRGPRDKIINQVSSVPLNYAWLRDQMTKEEQREITRQKLLQLHKSWDEKIGRLSKHLMKTVLLDSTKNTNVLDEMISWDSLKANEIPHRSNKSETESPQPLVSRRLWDKANREFKENISIPTGTDVEQRRKNEFNGNSKVSHNSLSSDQGSSGTRSR